MNNSLDTPAITDILNQQDDKMKNFIITMGSLDLKPSYLANTIYNKFNSINSSVYKVFHTSLGIIYDLYNRFIDLKKNHTEDFDKFKSYMYNNNFYIMDKYSNSKFLNLKDSKKEKEIKTFSFFDFIRLIYTKFSHNSDVAYITNMFNYLETVSELRSELLEESISVYDNLIGFDIENHPEFSGNDYNCEKNIAFKLRPRIINVNKAVNGTDVSMMDFYWNVSISISDIIALMLYNFDESKYSSQEVFLSMDKEAFINEEITSYNALVERLSKFICFELIVQNSYTRMNYSKFVTKLSHVYDKVISDTHNNKIIAFIKNEGKKGLSNIKDNPFEKFTDILESSNVSMDEFTDDLHKYQPVYDRNESLSSLIKNIMDATIDSSTKTSEERLSITLDAIAKSCFKSAFTHYFEDTVSVFVSNTMNNTVGLTRTVLIRGYSREFDSQYNSDAVTAIVSSIDNYMAKEFFIDIYNRIQKYIFYKYTAKNNVKSSKENKMYLFSKFKRLVWMYLYSDFVYLSKISLFTDCKTLAIENDYNISSRLCSYNYILKDVQELLKLLFRISANNGLPYDGSIYLVRSRTIKINESPDIISKISYMISFLGDCIKGVPSGFRQDDDKLIEIIMNKYKSDGIIDIPNLKYKTNTIKPLCYEGSIIRSSTLFNDWKNSEYGDFNLPPVDELFHQLLLKIKEYDLIPLLYV